MKISMRSLSIIHNNCTKNMKFIEEKLKLLSRYEQIRTCRFW